MLVFWALALEENTACIFKAEDGGSTLITQKPVTGG
jgi:hypothetical protein